MQRGMFPGRPSLPRPRPLYRPEAQLSPYYNARASMNYLPNAFRLSRPFRPPAPHHYLPHNYQFPSPYPTTHHTSLTVSSTKPVLTSNSCSTLQSPSTPRPSATESTPCNTPATPPSSLQTPSVSTTSRPSPLSATDSTPHNPPTTITNPLSQLQSPSTTSSPPLRPSSPPASKSSDSPPQSVVAAASFPSSTHPTVSTKPSITPLPLKSTSPIRKRLRSSRRAKSEDQVIPLDDSSDSNEQADPLYQYGGSGKRKINNKKTDKRRTKKQTENWREDMSLFNAPLPLPGPSQKFNKSSQLSEFDVKVARIMFHNSSLDEKFVKRILSGVLEDVNVHWDDVCGLEHVKQRLKEMVVYPLVNPALFSGLRSPGKGLLLFGPPGTGKTLIGKCLATEARATFFSVTASTFGAKYFGETEVLAKTLFECARALQPSIIFIDEVDSVLRNNADSESGCSLRLRTELLTNMAIVDGCQTTGKEQVLVIGATNYPDRVDEAARRRFTRRLYIPLPDMEARKQQILRELRREKHTITEKEATDISASTDGYSGADLSQVCRNAAMGPIRSLDPDESLEFLTLDDVRAINMEDFKSSLGSTSKSVSADMIKRVEDFDKMYGSN
ncbi:Fidgetin-like protein 1 [Frankliniella fusca]|uniref:Fidgetin-like protein 1 n=1 Tax=Frankliniella fusca TaxID=407009 RepID=A0AAE1LIM9_9NEOP|nr:Fidgetin-like protein 1 [Frankliniella fusca]KAK3917862.1 Fidgetin-like protein 1 [Frankliniella fusca]KAK3921429.1 Fidgetin-like protein 1 [Frankliniella fusca]KAK3921636.1 Fidgetin-like protein 1 [Frankliniella fusca]KAK3923354.1 Fidgetin-like protein 1 [Frankliniella fusca]